MAETQNRLERFWTPERLGDGARSARARMARVNLSNTSQRVLLSA
jgi:hypothetical protein